METRLPARAVVSLVEAGTSISSARPTGSRDDDADDGEDDEEDGSDGDDNAAAGRSKAMRVRWPSGDSTKTTATRVHAKVSPTAAT